MHIWILTFRLSCVVFALKMTICRKIKKTKNILGLKAKSISQIVQYMFLFNEIDI